MGQSFHDNPNYKCVGKTSGETTSISDIHWEKAILGLPNRHTGEREIFVPLEEWDAYLESLAFSTR